MSNEEGTKPGSTRESDATSDGWLSPYLVVLAVALVIGIALLAYVAIYRDEIIAIVTQSPT